MSEKWEVFKWFLLAIGGLLILTFVGWLLYPASKVVERKVLEQSYQYQAGQRERLATLEAALVEVDAKLAQLGAEDPLRGALEAQRTTIKAQLHAARRVAR